jgi:hypothetical protein
MIQPEPPMEIHKPKPIHNWREFLKEYAIIVIGVLTALAAEQAVEWLHWQGEVKAARQAIFAEMATNSKFFTSRLASRPAWSGRPMRPVASWTIWRRGARPAAWPFSMLAMVPRCWTATGSLNARRDR